MMTAEMKELELGSGVTRNDDGTIEFDIKLTESWLPPHITRKVAGLSRNLPSFWRHRTPQKKEYSRYPVVGRVMSANVLADGSLAGRMKIGGSLQHPSQKDARDWILKRWKEGKKIGASIGAVILKDAGGEIIDAEPLEYSITPTPYYETCTREDNKMPEEEETSDDIQERLDAMKEEYEKKVSELEAKTEELEKREQEVSEKEAKIEEKRQAEIQEKEQTIETLQSKIEEMEAGFKEQLLEMERRPILAQIEQKEDEDVWKRYGGYIAKESPAKLAKILASIPEKEKEPEIVTSTLEEDKEGITREDYLKSLPQGSEFADMRERLVKERYGE